MHKKRDFAITHPRPHKFYNTDYFISDDEQPQGTFPGLPDIKPSSNAKLPTAWITGSATSPSLPIKGI